MTSQCQRKFVGVIFGNDMGNELYPLTKNLPKSNLPVGNKKLIVYQLEQFELMAQISSNAGHR
jgi:NDP-sugar pyrophosphorylase family protein